MTLTPTVTPSREALEEFLNRKFLSTSGYERLSVHQGNWTEFVDCLMAWAAPRPLRKEELLDAIKQGFDVWHEDCRTTHTNQLVLPAVERLYEQITEATWRWLSGQREKKAWCRHMDGAQAVVLGFRYDRGTPGSIVHDDALKFCPLCGQPRPVESSHA